MHKVFYLKYFLRNLAMFSWATCTVGLEALIDQIAIELHLLNKRLCGTRRTTVIGLHLIEMH